MRFEPIDMRALGAAFLYMAIREIPAYKSGRVLENAIQKILGIPEFQYNCVIPFFRYDEPVQDFVDGYMALAGFLESFRTEPQYALRQAAFECLENKIFGDLPGPRMVVNLWSGVALQTEQINRA